MENPGWTARQEQERDNYFIGAEGLKVMFMDIADVDGDGLKDAVVKSINCLHAQAG